MTTENYRDLLDRFFSGKTTSEENASLRAMLGESPDEYFERYSREVWNGAPDVLTENLKEEMKEELLHRIRAEKSRGRHYSWLKYIAVAASVCAAAIFGYMYADYSADVQTFEITAERGQKSSVTLPDGTVVWLNSASTIAYTSDYNSKNREISLNGEAYFDVAKNRKLPFDVKAGDLTVRALGTQFNVKAFPEDRKVTATLVEGCISASSGDSQMVLKPWQQVVLDRRTGGMLKSEVTNRNNPVPWRQNEILFEGENLKQVALILERMYNVEVLVTDDVADYSYTGLISNNSLSNVLELISGTSPVRYTMHGNVIKFAAK